MVRLARVRHLGIAQCDPAAVDHVGRCRRTREQHDSSPSRFDGDPERRPRCARFLTHRLPGARARHRSQIWRCSAPRRVHGAHDADVVAVRVAHDRVAGAPERVPWRLRARVTEALQRVVNAVDVVASGDHVGVAACALSPAGNQSMAAARRAVVVNIRFRAFIGVPRWEWDWKRQRAAPGSRRSVGLRLRSRRRPPRRHRRGNGRCRS